MYYYWVSEQWMLLTQLPCSSTPHAILLWIMHINGCFSENSASDKLQLIKYTEWLCRCYFPLEWHWKRQKLTSSSSSSYVWNIIKRKKRCQINDVMSAKVLVVSCLFRCECTVGTMEDYDFAVHWIPSMCMDYGQSDVMALHFIFAWRRRKKCSCKHEIFICIYLLSGKPHWLQQQHQAWGARGR